MTVALDNGGEGPYHTIMEEPTPMDHFGKTVHFRNGINIGFILTVFFGVVSN